MITNSKELKVKYKLSKYIEFSEAVTAKKFRLVFSLRTGFLVSLNNVEYENLLKNDFEKIDQSLFKKLLKNEIIIEKKQIEIEVIKNRLISPYYS